MNELVFRTSKGTLVTNSLLVAEKFSKDHKNVLFAIRNIISSAEKSAQYYRSDIYVDSSGKSNEMFYMNRDGFTLLAMGFNGAKAMQFKIDFIEAFNYMEKQLLAKQFELPKTFAQALQLAADQAKQIELQEGQIKALEPKAKVHDLIANSDKLTSMGDAAKVLNIGIGRNTLFGKLRNLKILMDTNVPYQCYIERGYFTVKMVPILIDGKVENKPTTYVTGRGLTWLSKILGQ
jgi:anti-repressor protein